LPGAFRADVVRAALFRAVAFFAVDFFAVDCLAFDLFAAVFLVVALRAVVFRAPAFFAPVFFAPARLAAVFRPVGAGGTRSPASRASESPIAIACSRLRTGPPRPSGPLMSVPSSNSCIARSTLSPAPRLYFRPVDFLVAMLPPT
jgi:hypothetical protein